MQTKQYDSVLQITKDTISMINMAVPDSPTLVTKDILTSNDMKSRNIAFNYWYRA